MPRFLIYNGLNDWGKGREMPKFAKERVSRNVEEVSEVIYEQQRRYIAEHPACYTCKI